MNRSSPLPPDFPPEWLAAYADGELDVVAAGRVERWLAEHPEAVELLEGQRWLSPQHDDGAMHGAIPWPSETQWHATLQQIHQRLQPRNAPSRGIGSGRSRLIWAACIGLVGLLCGWAFWSLPLRLPQVGPTEAPSQFIERRGTLPPANGPETVPMPAEPLSIASADDVEIVSISAEAQQALVVGRLPLTEALSLASASEVTFLRVDPEEFSPLTTSTSATPSSPSPMILWPSRLEP